MTWKLVRAACGFEPPPRFVGWRTGGKLSVAVEYVSPSKLLLLTIPLPPRFDLACHSPDGFECGYRGSGPHQLALAMAAFCLEDDALAGGTHGWLVNEVVADLPRDRNWRLDVGEVRKLCQLMPVQPN